MVTIDGYELPARWLRDHGDDAGSVHPQTLQREVDTFAIPRDVAAVSVENAGETLTIGWSDGATTGHDLAALLAVVRSPRTPGPSPGSFRLDSGAELWSTRPVVTTFPAPVIEDDRAWTDALGHLRRFGWVRFDGAPLGDAAVRRLAGRIGGIRTTLFGDVWRMAPGDVEHQDSAYAPVALDVHTDGTYLDDCPGTIVFAQQERDGAGGNSILVDGFAVARDLVEREPTAAELLARYDIGGRYLEPGVSVHADRPPLRVDAQGVLRQVSFNNYDRAPVLPAHGWVDEVIDAYAAFRALATEPARALELTWAPGELLLIDNWRVLHGRTHYTGNRVFLGCYTGHEELESAYRRAGL
ncbi:MAG: TauD/TfdA family dioxygenase [Acidimicrobiales bacterium]|nr:TauD/TfdA family dioxygenase [Acidimicrobiales bacterium]